MTKIIIKIDRKMTSSYSFKKMFVLVSLYYSFKISFMLYTLSYLAFKCSLVLKFTL